MKIFLKFLAFIAVIIAGYGAILSLYGSFVFGIFLEAGTIYTYSGFVGFLALLCSLVLRTPRPLPALLGVFCAILLFWHALAFFHLDFALDFARIADKLSAEPRLIVGIIAFLALFAASIVSLMGKFRALKMPLVVLFGAVLALLHILLAQKSLSLLHIALAVAVASFLALKIYQAGKNLQKSLQKR